MARPPIRSPARPTRRAGGLALGSLLLFLIGTNVQAGWLFVLSSLLLGVVVVGLVLPRRLLRGIEVERSSPPDAFQGDDVTVELVLANPTRTAKLSVEAEDRHVGTARHLVPLLRPGERVRIASRRRATRRGVAEVAEVALSTTAPFGAGRARRVVAVPGRTVVYPRVVRLEAVPSLEAFSTFDRVTHASGRRGRGHDFLGIREYRVGDSMRHVHWPSTARHGAVMVREFEQEHLRRLGILLDVSADRGEEDTPLDLSCSVAASVAVAALDAGHAVQLAAVVDGELSALTEPDRARLLTWLAGLRPHAALPLSALVAEAPRLLRGSEAALVVLPTWETNAGLGPAIEELGSRGIDPAVVLVEADSFPEGEVTVGVLAPDGADALAGDLRGRGIPVSRVRCGEDLAARLHRGPAS